MTDRAGDTQLKKLAKTEFLAVCGDDAVPEELWRLLAAIRDAATQEGDLLADSDAISSAAVRRMTIEIVRELLEAGMLRAWFTNCPVTDTYCLEPALEPVAQTMRRIESEWDALGRDPSMCEIAAFLAVDQNSTCRNGGQLEHK